MSGQLASGVSESRRAELVREWETAVVENTAILTRHLLAGTVQLDTLLQLPEDATREAGRRAAIEGVRRDVFSVVLKLTSEVEDIELCETVALNHPRFGLTPIAGDTEGIGHPFLVIGVEPDAARALLRLSLWGTAGRLKNGSTGTGDYMSTDDGRYGVTG